jgi:hypothetical protein
VNVRVLGGLRVDKTLLRQAAVNARPATDEELRRALPPLKPHNLVDRLRQWLASSRRTIVRGLNGLERPHIGR